MKQSPDPDLLQILVCPLTRSPLRLQGNYLISQVGGLKYPIKDGIPVLLVDQAELPEGISSLDEFKRKFKNHIPD
ncbi:MAG TPA: Trm112 family protein [Phycisphaerae bacterium]|nr:Trm112 family protein [Phycisphaerae bacterium]